MKTIIVFLLFIQIGFSQDKKALENISLPLTGGLTYALERMEKFGFQILESHPEEKDSKADIILKDTNGSIIIYYVSSECFAQNWCNTLYFYTNKKTFDLIKTQITEDSECKFIDTKVTQLGISESYFNGKEDEYPFTRFELTKITTNGESKYLICIKNSPGYFLDIKNWKFERRYKKYE